MKAILTIGEGAEIVNFITKQAGYGRQHLYVNIVFNDKFYNNIYVMDVFPNIHEHFAGQAILSQDAFYQDDKDYSTDANGKGKYTFDQIFDTTNELLNYVLQGKEVEIPEQANEEE